MTPRKRPAEKKGRASAAPARKKKRASAAPAKRKRAAPAKKRAAAAPAPVPVFETDPGRWAKSGRGGPGNVLRSQWFAESRAPAEEAAPRLMKALETRAAALAPPPPAPVKTPAKRAAKKAKKRTAKQPPGPATSANWMPIGPSPIVHWNQRYSGRVHGLAVAFGGTRAYAATANGGVWVTDDSGRTWHPLGEDFMSPRSEHVEGQVDALSCGAVAVRFGMLADDDMVVVGTGEATTPRPVEQELVYRGTGIRVLQRRAAGTWALEAENLIGHAVFKLAFDPTDTTGARIYAATNIGLFERPASNRSEWTKISTGSWEDSAISDLVVVRSGGSRVMYVAVWNTPRVGNNSQVWRRIGNGAWQQIPGMGGFGRVALAVSTDEPRVVYALAERGLNPRANPNVAGPAINDGPNVWRHETGVDAGFLPVANVPTTLFGAPPNPPGSGTLHLQGYYDNAIMVDPEDRNVIFIGGSGWGATAAVFEGRVTTPAPPAPRSFAFTFTPGHDRDAWNDPLTFVGANAHPDIHAIVAPEGLSPVAGPDADQVWLATDGGVYVRELPSSSDPLATRQANRRALHFEPRNVGLATLQMTHIAHHPNFETIMLAGTQDNGVVRYEGSAAWRTARFGDGGGVAIDATDPRRQMAQYVRATLWDVSEHVTAPMHFPTATAGDRTSEDTVCENVYSFYAPIASFPSTVPGDASIVAFGTDMVWISFNWGFSWSQLLNLGNPYLPAAPPPPAPPPVRPARDALDGRKIVSLQFVSATELWAATTLGLYRFRNITQTAAATLDVLVRKAVTQTGPAAGRDGGIGGCWSNGLPSESIITDFAVVNSSNQECYVTLGGYDIDHVWYHDADGWRSAGLTQGQCDVSVNCVVVDPDHPTEVYVGSDIGVWRGVRTPGGDPEWRWSLYSQALPEAAVVDLVLHQPSRLLRAATHGRGVYELSIDHAAGRRTDWIRNDVYIRRDVGDAGRRRAFDATVTDPTLPNVAPPPPPPPPPPAAGPVPPPPPPPPPVPVPMSVLRSPDIGVYTGAAALPAEVDPALFAQWFHPQGTPVHNGPEHAVPVNAGVRRIGVQVHARAIGGVAGPRVRVAALLLPGMPQPLPANWRAMATAHNWAPADWAPWTVLGSFAPPLLGLLTPLTPRILVFEGTFNPGFTTVVAIVVADDDPLGAGANTNVAQVVTTDRHVACKLFHA